MPAGAFAAEQVAGEARAFTAEIVIVRGAKVRLAGLGGPGPAEVCHLGTGAQPCAQAAKQALEALIEGQRVICILERKVGHGSFQGSCRLDDGTDLGESLVAGGWARAKVSGDGRYGPAEAAARAAGRGLWATTTQ